MSGEANISRSELTPLDVCTHVIYNIHVVLLHSEYTRTFFTAITFQSHFLQANSEGFDQTTDDKVDLCFRCSNVGQVPFSMTRSQSILNIPYIPQKFGQTNLSKQCRPRSDATESGRLIRVYNVCHSYSSFEKYQHSVNVLIKVWYICISMERVMV